MRPRSSAMSRSRSPSFRSRLAAPALSVLPQSGSRRFAMLLGHGSSCRSSLCYGGPVRSYNTCAALRTSARSRATTPRSCPSGTLLPRSAACAAGSPSVARSVKSSYADSADGDCVAIGLAQVCCGASSSSCVDGTILSDSWVWRQKEPVVQHDLEPRFRQDKPGLEHTANPNGRAPRLTSWRLLLPRYVATPLRARRGRQPPQQSTQR